LPYNTNVAEAEVVLLDPPSALLEQILLQDE